MPGGREHQEKLLQKQPLHGALNESLAPTSDTSFKVQARCRVPSIAIMLAGMARSNSTRRVPRLSGALITRPPDQAVRAPATAFPGARIPATSLRPSSPGPVPLRGTSDVSVTGERQLIRGGVALFGNAQAYRHVLSWRARMVELQTSDQHPNRVGHLHRPFFVHAGQDHRELLAAIPRRQSSRVCGGASDHLGNALEATVPGLVAQAPLNWSMSISSTDRMACLT